MKAWVVRKTGVPSTSPHFQLELDYPRPVPTGELVLVRVHAVGINIGSGAKPMFAFPIKFLQKIPGVPESEFSGEIAGGKLDGTGFALGDEVFGILPSRHIQSGVGALSEYTIIHPSLLLRKPATMSHAEAASITMALLIPFWGLVKEAGLTVGQKSRVFVNGGSGGVGQGALQVAKAFGAYVVSTGSPTSSALLRSLGADEVIDYRSVHLRSHLSSTYSGEKSFDAVFDTVGSARLYRASPHFLKPAGFFGSIGGPGGSVWECAKFGLGMAYTALPAFLGGTPRTFSFVLVPQELWGTALQDASELVWSGKFKATIDSEFKMEDAKLAYERVLSGRCKGKVVVHVL